MEAGVCHVYITKYIPSYKYLNVYIYLYIPPPPRLQWYSAESAKASIPLPWSSIALKIESGVIWNHMARLAAFAALPEEDHFGRLP